MNEIISSGTIILALIALLSVTAVGIIIERMRYFRKSRADEDRLLERIRHSLEKGFYDEALSICEQNPGPLSDLMKVGIEYRKYSPEVIHDLISDAANLEVPKMERNIALLGTIAHITPLLGLLGTVTGNIQAFGVLSDFGAAADPGLLAGGIAEALVTTAAGIVAAIPAIAFYNQLVSKVNHNLIRLENRVSELVVLLKGDVGSKTMADLGTSRAATASSRGTGSGLKSGGSRS